MGKQEDYVLRTVQEREIRFVRLWFTDVLGYLKSFAITPNDLETAFEEGMAFDGSAIDGFSRVQESDMLARPDPNTFRVLPWRGDTNKVARMFCNIVTPDGEPFEGDPRSVLQRNLQRAADLGYSFWVGPEVEYFYFADSGEEPKLLDRGGYFDLTPLDVAQEYRRSTITALEEMGISVKSSHHEVSPSQHELDLHHDNALTMADSLMTTRLAVKEVAMEYGIYATFMPKPLENYDGNGLHLHLSLLEGDRNAFYTPGGSYGLSPVAQSFIAGLLTHARAITAITNQWVNSYKRLVAGFEAPVHITWARNNRSALARIPYAKAGKPQSTRVEYRAADPACNPYLAFSVILAAGLDGIEKGMQLPPETTSNAFEMTDDERAAAGMGRLPGTLSEALDAMEQSEMVADALGEHLFEWFLRNKRREWDRYQRHVSRYELQEYLPLL
jgi:glutamine synthetase